jgi:Holliday junction DNA helicase RuvA
MIAYMEGKLLKKSDDRILLLANQVGYEVLVPAFVGRSLGAKQLGDTVALFIYYHQTERQPKPVLIGFNIEAEKEFFQQFITVDAIGPLKAAKALTMPIHELALAIESNNMDALKQLRGIGARTAQKIVATLQGKVGKYTLIRKPEIPGPAPVEDFVQPVLDVLVDQLGHKPVDAKRMVADALKRNSAIDSPEALFDEVYKGEKE